MDQQQLANYIVYNHKPIDFRYGKLKFISDNTKSLLKDHRMKLVTIYDIPGAVSAYLLKWVKTIVLSKSFVYSSPKVLEATLLHEFGHYVLDEMCETKVDKYVVEQGFGEELYEALTLYCYFNDMFIYQVPSIGYRLRRIRKYLKEV